MSEKQNKSYKIITKWGIFNHYGHWLAISQTGGEESRLQLQTFNHELLKWNKDDHGIRIILSGCIVFCFVFLKKMFLL